MPKKSVAQAVIAEGVKFEKFAVEILSPVLHDGEKLVVGAIHELEAAVVARLVKLGVVKAAPKPAPVPAPEQ